MRRMAPPPLRDRVLGVTAVLLCTAISACDEPLVVGGLRCPAGEGGAGGEESDSLRAPWETSFEDSFCGYDRGGGFCYSDSRSGYRLVTSPVRTGPFAAAFELGAGGNDDAHQARCVRQGALPEAAYYSAWYYIPTNELASDNWNLFHFQGGEDGRRLLGTWDVSLYRNADGQLALFVWDLRTTKTYRQETPIVLDRWFQIEFFLKKAADETGEVALFQDGEELLRISDVVTDDSPFTQWYVGNYLSSPTSLPFVLYVDDVRIRLPP